LRTVTIIIVTGKTGVAGIIKSLVSKLGNAVSNCHRPNPTFKMQRN